MFCCTGLHDVPLRGVKEAVPATRTGKGAPRDHATIDSPPTPTEAPLKSAYHE